MITITHVGLIGLIDTRGEMIVLPHTPPLLGRIDTSGGRRVHPHHQGRDRERRRLRQPRRRQRPSPKPKPKPSPHNDTLVPGGTGITEQAPAPGWTERHLRIHPACPTRPDVRDGQSRASSRPFNIIGRGTRRQRRTSSRRFGSTERRSPPPWRTRRVK
jgi:hypothetical protein